MMKEYVSIEKEVEHTLNSIDGIHAVSAPKYLYERVLRRLENEQSNIFENLLSFVSEPIIAIGITLLVLILDLQVISIQKQTDYSLPEVTVQNIYQEDYDLAANFYDYDVRDQ